MIGNGYRVPKPVVICDSCGYTIEGVVVGTHDKLTGAEFISLSRWGETFHFHLDGGSDPKRPVEGLSCYGYFMKHDYKRVEALMARWERMVRAEETEDMERRYRERMQAERPSTVEAFKVLVA